MTAFESKSKLVIGNDRFAAGLPAVKDLSQSRIHDLSDNGQHPFAVIICCADSRVPPEIVFDQGLGDLFIVRTAGNVLDDVGMGSVEYGAQHLHIPLIVVLGHEKCGAVKATVDADIRHESIHGCIKSITDKIEKSLKKVRGAKDICEACEDENIRNTVDEIKRNKVIGSLLKAGQVEIAGAKYGINSGKITFFNSI